MNEQVTRNCGWKRVFLAEKLMHLKVSQTCDWLTSDISSFSRSKCTYASNFSSSYPSENKL